MGWCYYNIDLRKHTDNSADLDFDSVVLDLMTAHLHLSTPTGSVEDRSRLNIREPSANNQCGTEPPDESDADTLHTTPHPHPHTHQHSFHTAGTKSFCPRRQSRRS